MVTRSPEALVAPAGVQVARGFKTTAYLRACTSLCPLQASAGEVHALPRWRTPSGRLQRPSALHPLQEARP